MSKNVLDVKVNLVLVAVFATGLLSGCGVESDGLSSNTPEPPIINTPTGPEEDLDVLVDAVNIPDVQGSSEYYQGVVYSQLLDGPLIGTNEVSNDSIARSLPFTQVRRSSSFQIQRVVTSSYTSGRDETNMVFITIKNITNQVACGDSIRYKFNRSTDVPISAGGGDPFESFSENWQGGRLNNPEDNFVVGAVAIKTSCIAPNSSIYITGRFPPGVTVENLVSLDVTGASALSFDDDFLFGDFAIEFERATITPVSYTLGSLPESDNRVRTGASDEFVKVIARNTGSEAQEYSSAIMFGMDSNGYPVTRTFRLSDPSLGFGESVAIDPGAEFEVVFRNDLEVGEISSIRVNLITRAIKE